MVEPFVRIVLDHNQFRVVGIEGLSRRGCAGFFVRASMATAMARSELRIMPVPHRRRIVPDFDVGRNTLFYRSKVPHVSGASGGVDGFDPCSLSAVRPGQREAARFSWK